MRTSQKSNPSVTHDTMQINVQQLQQNKSSANEQVLRSAMQNLKYQIPSSPTSTTQIGVQEQNQALLVNQQNMDQQAHQLGEQSSAQHTNAALTQRDWKSVAWTEDPSNTHTSNQISPTHDGASVQPYDLYHEAKSNQIHGSQNHASTSSQAHNTTQYNSSEEVIDQSENSFIEPLPLDQVEMEDPPLHEVVSFEEEVKTDLGWFHLKTVDLAPFRPAIKTSIYQTGVQIINQDESYLTLYQQGIYSTEIAKKVERIHHQNKQLLQAGGVEAWLNAH